MPEKCATGAPSRSGTGTGTGAFTGESRDQYRDRPRRVDHTTQPSEGRLERRRPMRAALFDMDRTLVRKETLTLYVRYQREIGEATRRDMLRVLYWVGQYTLGIIDAPD